MSSFKEIMRLAKLLIFILFAFQSISFSAISIEQVGQVFGSPAHSSLVLDSSNNPNISYWGSISLTLQYAKKIGSAWSVQTLDASSINVGMYNSIALDSSNNLHISYYDAINSLLKYAKWNGSSWSIQTIDIDGDVGSYSSIALDSSNNPNISYYDGTNRALKYAKWTGVSWSTQTIDSGYVGDYTSIALDSSNNPHVSYHGQNATDGGLKYAKWSGSSWSTQTIDLGGSIGRYTSIALDTNNNPHVSYNSLNSALKYAQWTGSSWSTQTVDLGGIVGTYSSIALDSNNKPRISYCDETNLALKYARWTGLLWSTQTIATTGIAGQYASFALYPDNNAKFSYVAYSWLTYADLTYYAPVLSWTGEVNFTAYGVNPQTGDRATNFSFRVKYSDADNQAPNAGYPSLHIKQGGVEISGSPFGMTFVSSTTYTAGAVYTYTKTLMPGADYTYYFEAQDSDGVDASGAPTAEVDAPDVSNQVPALAWTGETNYTGGGLYPLRGAATDNYVFRVKYTDADNDAPAAGYPKVNIKRGGAPISGSPFVMAYVSGADNTGAIYSLSKTLASGDYAYSFDALDLYSGQASGAPFTEQSGPLVIGGELPPAQEVKVYHGVFKPGQDEKTNVSFNTAAPVTITVTVYNNVGRKVKEIYRGTSSPGLNNIQWDGRDSGGARVSSGVYTIKIEGGGINQSRRVVVVR